MRGAPAPCRARCCSGPVPVQALAPARLPLLRACAVAGGRQRDVLRQAGGTRTPGPAGRSCALAQGWRPADGAASAGARTRGSRGGEGGRRPAAQPHEVGEWHMGGAAEAAVAVRVGVERWAEAAVWVTDGV
jgi:hypothetical protein